MSTSSPTCRPDGADLFWDTSGHHDLAAAVEILARGGTVLVTAGLDTTAGLPVGTLYTRDLTVRGFAMSALSTGELAAASRMVGELISDRRAAVRDREVISLEEVAGAYERMRTGHVHGRIVVRI